MNILNWLNRLTALLLLALTGYVYAQPSIPAAGHRVTDLTGTLSAAETEKLAGKLEHIEQATGARVLVLVVPTLDGEPIEDYAQRVFEAWKPGRPGVDDGLLMVLAKHERKIRLAVGRGLEGAIPDLAAKRISSTRMVPAFKEGRFAAGFEAAASEVEQLIQRERAAAPAAAPQSVSSSTDISPGAFIGIILTGLFAWMAMLFVKDRQSKALRARRRAEFDKAQAQLRAQAATFAERAPRSRTVYPAPPSPPHRVSPRRASAAVATPAPAPSPRRTRSDDTSDNFTAAPVVVSTWASSPPPPPPAPAPSSNEYSSGSSGGDTAGAGASDSY